MMKLVHRMRRRKISLVCLQKQNGYESDLGKSRILGSTIDDKKREKIGMKLDSNTCRENIFKKKIKRLGDRTILNNTWMKGRDGLTLLALMHYKQNCLRIRKENFGRI